MKAVIINSKILIGIFALLFTSCVTVRQGEVGVKRKLGTYADRPFTEGLRVYNPITSTVIKISTQTENLEVALSIPSRFIKSLTDCIG